MSDENKQGQDDAIDIESGPHDKSPFQTVESYESVGEEDDVCDCDPAHKETQTIPQSGGMRLGVVGANLGGGDAVIVCKNCATMFGVEDARTDDAGLF